MEKKFRLLLLLALLLTAATGAWAQDAKHLITATYREQTRSLEQPLPYATTIGELYEAVSGQSFSDLISSMSSVGMPLTGITSRNTSIVSIGEFNGASTPVTVIADGETIINLIFGSYVQGIPVSATSPLYAYMKDGVKDADKWTVKVDDGQAQALPIGGLKGDGSETVTLKYTGRLKVKGVKATSEAAAPSVPDGAISGKFSVSDGKQVYFSKGNLRYASSKWSFFDNQYDFYTSYSADAWDKFGWSTSATTYGMSTSSSNGDYSGDFVDWGATMGAGWRTLTSDEWAYLLKTRSASTVNGTENGRYAKAKVNDVGGVILFPDTYTHPDGVAAPTGVNATDEYGWEGNSYTAADWTKMESAGCVFLPAAGCRYGSEMIGLGSYGYYGSATPDGADYAYRVKFNSGSLEPANSINRCLGCSVRLVQEATSDAAPAAPAATTLDNTTTAWSAGTFVVPADGLTYSDAITVSGDVTLVLTDGETLTLNKGISLAEGATLTVEGNGTMNVNGTNNSTASTVAGTGMLVLTSGTLTATGGNGGSVGNDTWHANGGNGGDAINGSVTVSGGTLTAIGGNGGNIGNDSLGSHGGNGGDAISGTLTINGGSTSVNNGSNGSIGSDSLDSTAGKGGKAVAGTVTDNRN